MRSHPLGYDLTQANALTANRIPFTALSQPRPDAVPRARPTTACLFTHSSARISTYDWPLLRVKRKRGVPLHHFAHQLLVTQSRIND